MLLLDNTFNCWRRTRMRDAALKRDARFAERIAEAVDRAELQVNMQAQKMKAAARKREKEQQEQQAQQQKAEKQLEKQRQVGYDMVY